MRVSRRKKLFLFSLLAILVVSASSFLKKADDSNPSLGMQIYRLEDGTTLVVNTQKGFEFSIPSGWYSLLVPASPSEIEEFNTVSQQNNLPLDEHWVSKETYDGVLLIAADLDPNDYEDSSKIPIELFYTDIVDIAPNGLITPVIDVLKSSGRVTNADVKDYSGQDVGIVEFQSLANETPFLGGKLLVFIRGGYVYVIMGATSSEEVVPKIKLAIDTVSDSLNFYDRKK